jgi:hypothetical protein
MARCAGFASRHGAGNSDANYGVTLEQRGDLMGLGDHGAALEIAIATI